MVPNYVYLPNDPAMMLYYRDSVSKGIKVIEANAVQMLQSLEKRLTLLDESGFEWLYCPICYELPTDPVFLPTNEGIQHLYEKIKLTNWFNNQIKDDPCNLKKAVKSSQYISPTPQQVLEFVMKSSGFPIDVFVGDYTKLQIERITPEKASLLDSPTSAIQNNNKPSITPQRSKFSLFMHSLFSCNKKISETPQNSETSRHTY